MAPNPEIGRYRLEQRSSGEGNVWLAEDLEDPGTHVVVKFLARDSDVFGFRQQGHTLAELDQPGIVAPIDSGESSAGTPFFVFPYIEGRTVRQVLNEEGPLHLRRAASVLHQLGAILTAAHSKHIVHGALDPEHILLTHVHAREVVRVINFGAWRVSSETSTPLGYLAPEYRAGQITIAGDIFSFGAIAAELLTGRRAFRYGSEPDLERQQRIGMARGSLRKLRHQIPVRVEDEIRRALAYDPAHRPGDAEVMGNRLADALGEGARQPMRRILLFAGLFAAVAAAATFRSCRQR